MTGVAAIVRKDLTECLRDKSFFIYGLATPLMLAIVLNLVFGDLESGSLEIRFGVQNQDDHEVAASITHGLAEADDDTGVHVVMLDGTDQAAAIDEYSLDAVITIPAGFGDQVISGEGGQPQLEVTADPDRSTQAGVVQAVAEGIAADLQRTRLLTAAGSELGVEPAADTDSEDLAITAERTAGSEMGLSGRMMAGMAVMFVFFTVQFGVTSLLTERKDGTMTRLLAAPISRIAIVGAKGLVGYVLGVIATLILLGTATVLMDAQWGSWLGVIVLVMAVTSTAVAVMAVVAGVAKTTEGASAVQSIIAVGLAVLGGSWFVIPDVGLMGILTRLTPHHWFLDGIETLPGASSWTAVLPHAAILVGIALLFGVPAAVLLQKRLAG